MYPRVSIIIPVYNQLVLTQKCLEALAVATDLEHCEIIIVDDASTDGTSACLQALAAENALHLAGRLGAADLFHPRQDVRRRAGEDVLHHPKVAQGEAAGEQQQVRRHVGAPAQVLADNACGAGKQRQVRHFVRVHRRGHGNDDVPALV